MFQRVLIANRGEIACRIIRTLRRLGLESIAVFSDADASAQHVKLADAAYRLGPAAAAESYLNIEAIIRAARASGAQAIHPGYGFLSENAAFAEACAEAGICFIGPPAEAIRLMGDKAAAKRIAQTVGAPLVPGYAGQQDQDAFVAAAARIGYPVLLKAAAGGGGRGMRVVERPEDLLSAMAGARRESQLAFGQDALLLEKYIQGARHIEVQVFADRFGNIVHLGDRDCSLQRRHQKLVEEAPAPDLPMELRQAMAKAAIDIAKAVQYVGAGTVEFLYADGRFHFIEMNTRLQVEHPVSEMITDLDLVEWQLRVAAGESLPLTQDEIRLNGHAIEIRLCAEDPERDFLPTGGAILRLGWPIDLPGQRIDCGIAEGDRIGTDYDSMLGKLIAWGETRDIALHRLQRMIAETRLAGVVTNRDFIGRVMRHPDFMAARINTGFFTRYGASLAVEGKAADRLLALACIASILQASDRDADQWSPWRRLVGWEANLSMISKLHFHRGSRPCDARVTRDRQGHWRVEIDDRPAIAVEEVHLSQESVSAMIEGRQAGAHIVADASSIWAIDHERTLCLIGDDPLARAMAASAGPGSLRAPMPGTIAALLVKPGDAVAAGKPLVILEAMKMEHVIVAPQAGTIMAVHFTAGQQVAEGVELLALASGDES